MPKHRTETEKAAGKLITAIQKEWGAELGTSTADVGEHVLGRAHELLHAASTGTLRSVLGTQGVTDFLGPLWVRRHPAVLPAIHALESRLFDEQNA